MTTKNTLSEEVSMMNSDSGEYIYEDLATVSCFAASALESISLGHNCECVAVRKLIDLLKGKILIKPLSER